MNIKKVLSYFFLGFIVGLGLAVIFTPLTVVTNEGNGVTSTYHKSFSEYAVFVLRIGFSAGFIGMIVSLIGVSKQKKSQ
ncbi:hypothetical protein [Priestia koreensis]|uniref:Uncharacterized protein n=1 Tax=Priestia koreensis TaxID=284581 RepID=A0A0M0KNC5_9BACI|nr:hypothetical protein [Priestia koreensis]KOO40305.1 hypothetical protein AMD01_21360 [Priestia koreensis]